MSACKTATARHHITAHNDGECANLRRVCFCPESIPASAVAACWVLAEHLWAASLPDSRAQQAEPSGVADGGGVWLVVQHSPNEQLLRRTTELAEDERDKYYMH